MTLWVLGLSLLIVLFGGLALDFWRVLAVQRATAAVADSAAIAAASGIDEARYREDGTLLLDPDRAVALGEGYVAGRGDPVTSAVFEVSGDGTRVDVEVVDEIEGGFVAFFTGDDGVITIRVTATASPRLVP